MSITDLPLQIHIVQRNISICCKARVNFREIKLGRYVIVHVGENMHVTFQALNVCID